MSQKRWNGRQAELLGLCVVVFLAGFARAAAAEQVSRTAENILLYQRDNGGWPKNYDRDAELSPAARQRLLEQKVLHDTMFDNGATHSETAFLAREFTRTGDPRCREAVLRGIDFMLEAQYENGGWPQSYPDRTGYHRYVTFNDNAMIGVMTVLRDVAEESPEYRFVDGQRRQRAAQAVVSGVECILKCQIVVDGKKTAWCAQHDERTFEPVKARSYELASVSGSESVGVVRFLMRIDRPEQEILDAIESAVAWLQRAKLDGIRQVQREDTAAPKGWDKVVIRDPQAPPLWARFYDIQTNEPIFCSRDGVPRRTLAEISYERRNGYSWLGYYATDLLAKDYPAWRRRLAAE